MKRVGWILLAVVAVAALRLLWTSFNTAIAPPERGPAGIDFVIPPEYAVLDLGEARLDSAAARLRGAVDTRDRVGAVFTRSGDRIQLLVDAPGEMIDERVMGRHGTVHRVLWPGPVRERLDWARGHDDLAAPGLPPPDRRNPYH
jgi:hypothetical protein